MKQLRWVLLSIWIGFFGVCNAQTEQGAENKTGIKEVPTAAEHGKAVSELAKNTDGAVDKGKPISSAARPRGLLNMPNDMNASKKNNGSNNGSAMQNSSIKKVANMPRQNSVRPVPSRPKPVPNGRN